MRSDEPERPLDTDHDSKKESYQDSNVPTGRESRVRRPPVRCGIHEFFSKNKKQRYTSSMALPGEQSHLKQCKLTIRSDYPNRSNELRMVRMNQSCSTNVAAQDTAIGVDWRSTHALPIIQLPTKLVNSHFTLSTVLTTHF